MKKRIVYIIAALSITKIAIELAYNARGYSAVGGEFLVVPLLVVLYQFYLAIKARWEETEEYFKKKAIQE